MAKEKGEIYQEVVCPLCTMCFYVTVPSALEDTGQLVVTCPCEGCHARFVVDKRRINVSVTGTNAEEVQKVSLALMEKSKRPQAPPSPWVSGSFYLIVFVVVIVALSVVGRLLPIYALPTVLIGGLLALSVIGAFQLRQDERLNEENFLKLMALSFKYLPWIRSRDRKTSKNTASTSPNPSIPDDTY